MKLKVKRIEKEDKQGIYNLIDAVNKVDNLGYSLTEPWFDYVIEEVGEGILVGYYGNQLIGLATCMINSVDRSQATLNIVIHPSFRNQGFGSSLYNKVIEYAKEHQVNIIEAYVKKRLDNAIGFAEKRNFQVVQYSWQMELELEKKSEETHLTYEVKDDMTFRKATIAEGKNYAGVIYECFGDEIEEDSLEQLLKDPSISVYILENKKEVIGLTTIQLKENLSLGYIYDVAVVKEHRGQGIGSYLLRQCIHELKKNGMKTASLLVAGENKNALSLYKRVGFKEVDTDLVMENNQGDGSFKNIESR